MPSTAPLFLESDSYTSTLYLVNTLTFGVQANVSLYDMSGALLTTKQLYLDANTQQSASIRRILSEGGLLSQAGSVEVLSPQNSAAVLGQLSITRTGASKAYLDEELFMPDEMGSRTLRAVIDSPENSPIVAITNVSSTASQTLHVSCLSSSVGRLDKTLSIQPKQTRLVRACSSGESGVFAADAIDSQFALKPESSDGMGAQGVAGISITTEGPPGELAAFGFVEHDDSYGRYFSAMNFADTGALHSTGTVFTGVPVGPSHLLPGGSSKPQVAVTNFSSLAQTVTVLHAKTTDRASAISEISTAIIAPGASRLIELPTITGDADWKNSFIVRSTGQAGDVLSKMMFKSGGTLPNLELIGKDEHDTHTAGDHPWTTENGTRSTLYLFNHSAVVKSVTVRIGSGASIWIKILELQPNETFALPINDVIGSGTPDIHQQVLPKDVGTGEVGWWAPSGSYPEVAGRVVQVDAAGSMARNFSCGSYVGLCGLAFNSSPMDLIYGFSNSESTFATYCMYYPIPPTGCNNNGQSTYTTTPLHYWYYSYNASIANVTSYSGSSSSWMGMAPGSTTAYVQAYTTQNSNNSCTAPAPVAVQKPTTIPSIKPSSIKQTHALPDKLAGTEKYNGRLKIRTASRSYFQIS